MTGTLGRRVEEFCALAEAVADALVESGEANTKGLRASGGMGFYGRYMRVRGHGAFVHFNARLWAAHGRSPMWLSLGFKDSPVRASWLHSHVEWFIEDGANCKLPLYIPVSVEHEAVIASLLDQARAVIAVLPAVTAAASDAPSSEEIADAADVNGTQV